MIATVQALLPIIAMLLVGVPPLTEEQRIALETAHDGRDHREAAFDALLENIAEWTEDFGDAAVRLHPDFEAIVADPDAYRGDLVLLHGRIAQIEPLRPPYSGVTSWILRTSEGEPVIAFVDARRADDRDFAAFEVEDAVELIARFYKRIDAEAGDGRVHQYAAFAGAFPREVPPASASSGTSFLAVMVALVAIMAGGFIVVFILARRGASRSAGRRPPRSIAGADEEDAYDAAADALPDDPAEALRVLQRGSPEPADPDRSG